VAAAGGEPAAPGVLFALAGCWQPAPSSSRLAVMLLARTLRSRLRPPLSVAAAFSSAPASAAAAEAERAIRDGPRNDWSRPEIQAVYDSPLLDLLFHGVRTPSWAEHSRSQNPAVNPPVAFVSGTGLMATPRI